MQKSRIVETVVVIAAPPASRGLDIAASVADNHNDDDRSGVCAVIRLVWLRRFGGVEVCFSCSRFRGPGIATPAPAFPAGVSLSSSDRPAVPRP